MRLKQLIFHWGEQLRLGHVLRDSRWRSSRLLILCYHGISLLDEHEWNPSLYVSSAFFRERMSILRDEGYTVLPLSEAVRHLRDGTLPKRAVAITFDDGTADFADVAVPILVEFGYPATVYLTTYYSDNQLPVFDTALSYVLWKGRDSGVDLAPLVSSSDTLPVSSEIERRQAWQRIVEFAVAGNYSAADKDALLRTVAAAVDVDYESMTSRRMFHIMSPSAVRQLPARLVDVQLHTHRHRTPRSRDDFIREIEDNRRRLRHLAGERKDYVHFCYPSGDYDGVFLPWLRDLDVSSATTCIPGIATRSDNPLLLPRFVDTMSQSQAVFRGWLSGLAALLPKRRKHQLDIARIRDKSAH